MLSDPSGAYSASLRDAFERARSTNPTETIGLTFGDVTVQVFVVGEHLAEMLTTACRTVQLGSRPDVTIRAFDSASTGVMIGPPPWPVDSYLARDEVDRSATDDLEVSYDVERRVLNAFDPRSDEGIFWAADSRCLAPWEPAAPLRNVFHWALRRHGLQLAHGAVFGNAGRGLLLTARGGSGKSTTAAWLLSRGWDYVSDDYCLLDTTGVTPCAHQLYRVAKLDDQALARLDAPALPVLNPDRTVGDKAILDLTSTFGGRLVDRMALCAVVIPQIDPNASAPRLEALPPAAAGRALVPSTLLQLPGCNEQTSRGLARGITGLATYALHLPGELKGVDTILTSLLDETTIQPESAAMPR